MAQATASINSTDASTLSTPLSTRFGMVLYNTATKLTVRPISQIYAYILLARIPVTFFMSIWLLVMIWQILSTLCWLMIPVSWLFIVHGGSPARIIPSLIWKTFISTKNDKAKRGD